MNLKTKFSLDICWWIIFLPGIEIQKGSNIRAGTDEVRSQFVTGTAEYKSNFLFGKGEV